MSQPIARIETVQQVMTRVEYPEEQTPTEMRTNQFPVARASNEAPAPPPPPPAPPPPAQIWTEPETTLEWEEPTATHRSEERIPTPPPAPIATPLLIDVTPLSLSVETVGGYCDKLIARNTHVPCEESRVFVTTQEQQTIVRVRVCQGESEMFSQNTLLGEVELTNIVALARGQARIRVGFELDADGILQVRARDEQTGKVAQASLRLHGLADANDVEALIARQEEHTVG
jgi:molecular chaperone DnaK